MSDVIGSVVLINHKDVILDYVLEIFIHYFICQYNWMHTYLCALENTHIKYIIWRRIFTVTELSPQFRDIIIATQLFRLYRASSYISRPHASQIICVLYIPCHPPFANAMPPTEVAHTILSSLLSNLNSFKFIGPDRIHPSLLKMIAPANGYVLFRQDRFWPQTWWLASRCGSYSSLVWPARIAP